MKTYQKRAFGALIAGTIALWLPSALAGAPAAGDDFWQFANGDWARTVQIPAGNANWGVRAQLRYDNSRKMVALYEAAAAGKTGGAVAKKVGDYYMAQMDQAGLDAKGNAPLQPLLDRIAALDSKTALARHLGATLRIDADPVNFGFYDSQFLFGLWVGPGLHDTSHYQPYMLQGGLVLASPDSYLAEDAAAQAERARYRQYIVGMLAQAGIADAPRRADSIIALETRIAKVHAAPQDSADLAKAGTVWRRAEFRTRAPGLDWDGYFKAAGLSSQKYFGVWQPAAIAGIAAVVDATPMDAWRDYLAFHAINDHARFLPKAYSDRYFAFFDPIFLGPGQFRPLWEHALNQTNTDMPAAGQLFAENHFSPQARAKAGQLVANVVAAFGRHLEQLEWMSPASKKEALAKLNNLRIEIAYPDRWQDLSTLEIKADDALGNMERVHAFNYRTEIAKLGRPVDRSAWIRGGELFGTNAMPLQNALTIPVTELQAPLFNPDGPDAANYAMLGARVGRFLALLLDNDGGRFDALGRVRNWWSVADRENYKKASAALAAQLPAANQSGKPLNNNIADLAGLLVAYDAWQATGKSSKEEQQRFFIAYAESQRSADLKQPAPVYRAALVRNINGWYAAFDVMPEQALYLAPTARVKVW